MTEPKQPAAPPQPEPLQETADEKRKRKASRGCFGMGDNMEDEDDIINPYR